MDGVLSQKQDSKEEQHENRLALVKLKNISGNPVSSFSFWVAKFLRSFSCNGCFPPKYNGFAVKNSVFSCCYSSETPVFWSSGYIEGCEMEDVVQKGDEIEEQKDGLVDNGGGELFTESVEDCGDSNCSSSETLTSMATNEERSSSEESPPLGWPIRKDEVRNRSISSKDGGEEETHFLEGKKEKEESRYSEIELMKERFSKLLLGEDMSGSGKGVCTALAISNAITNLCATMFGQIWRLEPPTPEKKSMWRREMEWLLCVSDHIVELIPSWQTFPDGSKLEVMTCRPRSDLYINLPALRKLDNMLLEILDSFSNTEFWYVDQGILATDSDGSASFRRPLQRQEEKWWLPVPRVPPCGLHEKSRKDLQHKRECTNQILKAAMAINSNTLTEMEIPESYLEALPKNGRASLGDVIHRYITSDQFSPDCLLDCLDLSSEHQALEIANRVEASMYVWRRRTTMTANRSNSKSSWEMVKDLMVDGDKRELLADRAESLLLCLKQRFPGLPQTTLDMSKIQYNKDVGQSILESYSRVLESLAFNIIARIDDLLYVDDITKHSDNLSSVPTVSVIAHKRVSLQYSVPVSSTPYATAFTTPSFSPAPLVSPARGASSPFINSKPNNRGFGVKKVLTDYLGVEIKGKHNSNQVEVSDPISTVIQEAPRSRSYTGTLGGRKGITSPPKHD